MPRLVSCFSLLLVAALGFVPSVAAAAPYTPPTIEAEEPAGESLSCPTAEVPVLSEEEEEAVEPLLREVGHLRLESQQSCAALAGRADEQLHRLWWLVSEGVEARHHELQVLESLVVTSEAQSAILHRLEGDLEAVVTYKGVSEGEPLPVHDSEFVGGGGEGTSAETVLAIEESGEALRHALWYIAGAIAAGILAYAIYRQGLIKP